MKDQDHTRIDPLSCGARASGRSAGRLVLREIAAREPGGGPSLSGLCPVVLAVQVLPWLP